MSRLVWMVLQDGRSVVAACDSVTREDVASTIRQPGRTLIVHYADKFESIPCAAVRDFIVFDSRARLTDDSPINAKLSLFDA